MVQISVGALLNKAQGTQEKHSIESNLEFLAKDCLRVTKPFTADITLMKLPHEISVQMTNGRTAVEAKCSRCLTNFELPIEIASTEREFIIDLPEESLQAGEDVFGVDSGPNVIILDEMIRQEVLLHFAEFPVCSESCKGLCDRCGANKNKGDCSCPPKKDYGNPFKALTL